MTATIHLLCGSTGAGKTTHARDLVAQTGAVSFSIDAWMAALFWMDAPEPPDPAWAIARSSGAPRGSGRPRQTSRGRARRASSRSG
jgi:hypothetical protein